MVQGPFLAGYLPLPVHLLAGSCSDLVESCAEAASSGTRLLLSKADVSLAHSDATTIADALCSTSAGSSAHSGLGVTGSSSSCSSFRKLAEVVWGFASVEEALSGSANGCNSVIDGRGLMQCRTRVKALHMLLQSERIQLRVVAAAGSDHTDDLAQQQQQQQSHALQAHAGMPTSAILAAAPNSRLNSSSKRRRSVAKPHSAATVVAGNAACIGWLTVAVELQPEFFYTPAVPTTANFSSSASWLPDPVTWTLLPEDTPGDCVDHDVTGQQLAKAVNSLIAMLQDMNTMQQQRQLQSQQQQLELDTDLTDGEYQQIVGQQQQYMQQQQCKTAAACSHTPAAEAEPALPADQYDGQFELYSCPEAAAAAASDIRQSLFDWVDSGPWRAEAQDPPGLANSLYRYQRRALSWMMWREQHGTHPLGFSSSHQSPVSSDADQAAITAAQGLLGAQLLNPLWSEVKLTWLPPPPAAAAAVVAVEGSLDNQNHLQPYNPNVVSPDSVPASSGPQQPDQPHQQQQQRAQHVLLYHAVSHGLVSCVRPSGYCGPAGGVLADEMGLGKTVEVLALLLARPPPSHVQGILGAATATAGYQHNDASDDTDSDGGGEYLWTGKFRIAKARNKCQQHHGSHKQLKHNHKGPKATTYVNGVTNGAASSTAAAAADEGVTNSSVWPLPGKWAGPTLVVTPPAILQQWVSEARRHAPGLSVTVYDGLKWQRQQAEAEQRKQEGRMSKDARKQQALVEQYNYIVNGPPDTPAFDAAADAAEAVKQLLEVDLVVTTFDVLQQEVHFSGGNSERLSSLRHKKRYAVPESPLLQVHWWRLVLDEAQLVGGGFSATAVMAGHIRAVHRWAVTGTPIGAGGLDDVANLLRLIEAAPFDSHHTFNKAIQEPFTASVVAAVAALEEQQRQQHWHDPQHVDHEHDSKHLVNGYNHSGREQDVLHVEACQPGSGLRQQLASKYGMRERAGVRRLLSLVQPLMWRSNKEAAAADHPLPPRHLQCALLRFSPAERSFYNHIVEKTAAANKELQQQQEEEQQQQEQSGVVDLTAQQQSGRRGRARRGKAGPGGLDKQIQQVAAGGILQLRLACLHPQLTSYWRELSSELQLRQGGALSIAEILNRMKDGAQLKLQQAERELCVVLNVLADKLVQQADEATVAAAAAGSSKQQGKKRKRASSGGSKRRAPAAAEDPDLSASGNEDESYEPVAAAGSGGSRAKKRVRFAAAAGDGSDIEMDGSTAAAAAGSSGGTGSRRRGSSGSAAESPDELRAFALKLFEDSYKVGEYGIAAITGSSSSSVAPEPLVDIAGGDATWRAWKHVGLHTAQSLSKLCGQLDMSLKSELYAKDVARKRTELLETVTADEAKAQTKFEAQRAKAQELGEELSRHWWEAAAAGVPLAAMTGTQDASSWLSDLSQQIAAAKSAEEQAPQQHTDAQGATVTTVLLGQQVPKLLETLEAAAAADRGLFEGIVGQVHTRKVSALLRAVTAQLASGTGSYNGVRWGLQGGTLGVRFAAGTAGDLAVGRAGTDSGSGSNTRMAAATAARSGTGGGRDVDYMPEFDHESESEEDLSDHELDRELRRPGRKAAAADSIRQAAGASRLEAGAAAWAAGSDIRALLQQQQQLQQQAGLQAAAAVGMDSESFRLAAARAATHQFLDCLPERRVLWRLLYRGTLSPSAAAAAAVEDVTTVVAGSSGSSGVTLPTSESVATALAGLVQVYASTAFSSQTQDTARPHTMQSAAAAAQAAQQPQVTSPSTRQPSNTQNSSVGQQHCVDEYSARLCVSQSISLMRQLLRRLEKRESGFVKAVNTAAAAAPGGNNLAAAAALAAAYIHQQQQQAEFAGCTAAGDGSAIQLHDVNVPLLLQQLPLCAVAAAAESARVRIDVCRAERDVYVAERGLELAQHNKQLVEVEADTAAAGQMSQVVQLSEKSAAELRTSVTELTKKCDELLRHKRFLANQAAESTHFDKSSKKQDQGAAALGGQPAAGDGSSAGTAADAGSDGDEDSNELECAVCRSTMSDELQVFPCGHYFCDSCAAVQLAQPSPTCPYCRARLTRTGVFRVSLAGRGSHDPEVDPPEGAAVREIKVTGTWMTKLEALLRRVLLMRSVDPTAKALVFSQFPDALVLASKALDVVKVKHVSLGLGGGKDRRMAMRAAVKAFNEDTEVCIFLLSLRAGSSGLTLTVANRVFLLEPGLDPAIEQQAVARVHRIGQERPVIITRLLIEGTIEEQVLQISENKQALLTEAAQHHHHQHHQQHPGQQHAAAAADEETILSEEETLQAADYDMAAGMMTSPRKRRRSSHDRVSLEAPSSQGHVSGTAGDSSAPTTLQSLAPKKEQLGRDDVAGLLAAVLKQAGQQ